MRVPNRTATVKADGTWELSNVPAGSQVRARATCVENGVTLAGQSDFFTISRDRMNAIVPFELGVVEPIPEALALSVPTTELNTVHLCSKVIAGR